MSSAYSGSGSLVKKICDLSEEQEKLWPRQGSNLQSPDMCIVVRRIAIMPRGQQKLTLFTFILYILPNISRWKTMFKQLNQTEPN